MRIALLFPGQGSQHHDMLTRYDDLYHHDIIESYFDLCSKVINKDLKTLLENRSDQIHQTTITQPLLVAHALGCLELIQPALTEHTISCVAGHSLGELTATVASGLFSKHDAFELAYHRADIMQAAMGSRDIAMSVVLSHMTVDAIDDILQSIKNVWLVNDNCQGQVVIGGLRDAVEEAELALNQAGSRKILRLPMSVISHCPMLLEASQEFSKLLKMYNKGLTIAYPVGSNLTTQLHCNHETLIKNLAEQLVARVRFREMIDYLSKDVDIFIEVGAGTVLTNLLKKITVTPCLNTGSSEKIFSALALLKGNSHE